MTDDFRHISRPDSILTYFRSNWKALSVVTATGLIYNIGLPVVAMLEGKLVQCLLDIFNGTSVWMDMFHLGLIYLGTVLLVQGSRFLKRLYVRKFANAISRDMKHVVYNNFIHRSRNELHEEKAGSLMTRTIADTDACAEGMRKFTTEIFDTGVAMIAYCVTLFIYDWKLALLSMIFPPVSYYIAERMKKIVVKANSAYKESAGDLSDAALDRVGNAMTYRLAGVEDIQNEKFDKVLYQYRTNAIKADILVSATNPVYEMISLCSVVVIVYFGAKNVSGTGWTVWNIAAFTTFLNCFLKLAVKSGKAAKLFNAVHKAEVSWGRIKPFLQEETEEYKEKALPADILIAENLSAGYEADKPVFSHLNFDFHKGEIIGVSGVIASGKSTFGKVFLSEFTYTGNLKVDGKEWKELSEAERNGTIAYLGHEYELFPLSIKDNILLGESDEEKAEKALKAVCLDQEVENMQAGMDTKIGDKGSGLSGGQMERLALARTLVHQKSVMVLDDPFSALDVKTEKEVFANLRNLCKDSIVILISHRLALFPQCDQVVWFENGTALTSTHEALLKENKQYAEVFALSNVSPEADHETE